MIGIIKKINIKVMSKINTVVAKALAEKVVSQLQIISKESSKKRIDEIISSVKQDPLAKKYEKAMEEAGNAYKELQKKYKDKGFTSYKFSKETISECIDTYSLNKYTLVPNVNDIKNDIILGQASDDKFDAEQFIAKLVKDYTSKLKLK